MIFSEIPSAMELGEYLVLDDDFVCRLSVFDTSKTLVVTFHFAQGIPSKSDVEIGKDKIFAYDFLKRKGINVLSFSPVDRNNWYRSGSLFGFIKKISGSLTVFPERVGYGSSMGGFGLGSFFEELMLDRVLLLHPISTLNKRLAPFENRFKTEGNDWLGENNDASRINCPGYLVFDPACCEDKLHADRFSGLEKIRLIGGGHNIPRLLKEMGVLGSVFLEFLYSNEVSFNSKDKRKSEYYFQNLADMARQSPYRLKIIRAYSAFAQFRYRDRLLVESDNRELYQFEKIFDLLFELQRYEECSFLIDFLIKVKPDSRKYRHLKKKLFEQ